MYSENISVEVLEISNKNLAEKTFKNAILYSVFKHPFLDNSQNSASFTYL